MTENAFDSIIDFAIEREIEAHDFYADMAEKSKAPAMKAVFNEFAQEEMGHKNKLEGLKKGLTQMHPSKEITDLKISDYTVEVDPDEILDYQHALILAMKKEKAAFRLYMDLAETIAEENLKSIFKSLAQEEAKHKLRFELEYDQNILQEN